MAGSNQDDFLFPLKKKDRNRVLIEVDPMFRQVLRDKSAETGFSLIDLTRLAARNSDRNVVFSVKKKGRKKTIFEMDDPFITDMFK